MQSTHTKPVRRRVFLKRFASATIDTIATSALMGFDCQNAEAQERHYLSQAQALRVAFPSAAAFSPDEHALSDAEYTKICLTLRYRLSDRKQRVWKATQAGNLLGYAMVLNEIGKEQYITFMVALSRDFRVIRVMLMDFRESRGWEVQDTRFTNQFRGKGGSDPLMVGSDIQGITGATLSSDALCRGTRKAILVCQTIYSG